MAKKSVKLRGTKEGFILVIEDDAAFSDIMIELEELIMNMGKGSLTDPKVPLQVKTGNRLLHEDELRAIEELIHDKSKLRIEQVQSEVMSIESAVAWKERENVQTLITTVRNGQVIDAPGDLLLIGSVHQGGTVRSQGNIFVLGDVKGVLHAGAGGDESAIIIAKFDQRAQLRIFEQVDFVEPTAEQSEKMMFAYVNDLHVLSFAALDELKQLRPKMANKTGGLI